MLRDAAGRAMRSGRSIDRDYIEEALVQMQAAAGSDAAKAIKVSWDDVGGLANAKKEIIDCIELPLHQPELFASSLRKRSGLLLYGPPGTGTCRGKPEDSQAVEQDLEFIEKPLRDNEVLSHSIHFLSQGKHCWRKRWRASADAASSL